MKKYLLILFVLSLTGLNTEAQQVVFVGKDTASCSIITQSTSDDFSNYFRVTPNPLSENILIAFLNTGENKVHIELFDNTGKKVFDAENLFLPNEIFVISADGFNKGLYFLKMSLNFRSYSKKIIIY